MRVLFLSYRGNPYCGGQGIYLYNLGRELVRMGVEVDVIVGPPYPESMEDFATVHKLENLHMWAVKTRDIATDNPFRILRGLNFLDYLFTRFHFFGEMETFSIRAFNKVSQLLRKQSYDIIHDVNTLGWGLLPMKLFGVSVVSTIHHPLTRDLAADLSHNAGLWDKMTTLLFYPVTMQRLVSRSIDRIITSFKGGVKELQQAFSLQEKQVSVVYNGMDIDLFQNTGEKREENALLFVGNTEDEKKGIRYLLEAMTLLPEEVSLTIVDAGPPSKTVASSIIKKYGLEHRVTITGRLSQDELVSYYSRKTLVVISSMYEGFGLPAAEAMACETPVVATRAGALEEVVTPDTGFLVKPANPGEMSQAIIKLLMDKALRKKMGKAGRKRAVEHFSWPVAASNTLEVYKELIRKRTA